MMKYIFIINWFGDINMNSIHRNLNYFDGSWYYNCIPSWTEGILFDFVGFFFRKNKENFSLYSISQENYEKKHLHKSHCFLFSVFFHTIHLNSYSHKILMFATLLSCICSYILISFFFSNACSKEGLNIISTIFASLPRDLIFSLVSFQN